MFFPNAELVSRQQLLKPEFMERMKLCATETDESKPASTTKKKSKNKQRFSDEQIRSLESMFESETKVEARKKVEMAGALGLQPRQVAIWFQNRRARWKSKQIEQDLRILRANYNNLASQFQILKEEKKALIVKLQKLNCLLDRTGLGFATNGDHPRERARNSSQEELEDVEMENPYNWQKNGISRCMEEERCEIEVINLQEEKGKYINFVEEEEEGRQLWDIPQHLHASMTSPSFDNSRGSSVWLNFWT